MCRAGFCWLSRPPMMVRTLFSRRASGRLNLRISFTRTEPRYADDDCGIGGHPPVRSRDIGAAALGRVRVLRCMYLALIGPKPAALDQTAPLWGCDLCKRLGYLRLLLGPCIPATPRS